MTHCTDAITLRADAALRRRLRQIEPKTANQLHAYIRIVLGFTMPRRPIEPGHSSPFEYLCHAFFNDAEPRDALVWANRGGGKTQLGAIATLLDLLFRPGIEVRILGGSFDQSARMYRHLKRLLEDDAMIDLVEDRVTERGATLVNGSRVEVLSQSQRAVRGQRVHRLRCDEVELFDPDIWEAAQLTTRSGRCGQHFVRASIEALSTMHLPFGLMHRLVESAEQQGRRVFRWSILDTLAKCPASRPCETCELHDDCRGRAKSARGFIDIDDAVAQSHRVDSSTWESEMLCRRPNRSHSVYPEFDRDVHVRPFESSRMTAESQWIGGIDFGYRAPTVLLWAVALRDATGDGDVVHIVDEMVMSGATTDEHLAAASQKPWPRPAWIGADPAGHQRSEQTGRSVISMWKRAGWPMRTRPTRLVDGITAVRRRLRTASGRVSLRIDPRCRSLIEALVKYHYSADRLDSEEPVKDGPDHAADALRYMIVNLDRPSGRVKVRGY